MDSEEKLKRLEVPLRAKNTILVVDDSADNLSLSKTILKMDDYEVLTALSSEEALLLLSKIEPPSLILLDMQMSGISGIDFLAELEIRQPEIVNSVPVVFLTAMDKVPKSKAVGFIRKPIDINKFLASVRIYIEKRNTDTPNVSPELLPEKIP